MGTKEHLDKVRQLDVLMKSRGYDQVFEDIKKIIKTANKDLLNSDFFLTFFRDYKAYEKSGIERLQSHADYILNKLDKTKVIIFRIDDETLNKVDMNEIDKTKLIFPYHSFFVEKVIQMIESDRYCIDVLNQSKAVENALKQVDGLLLENHLKTCVVDLVKQDKAQSGIEEIMRILKRT